ncbi:NAD-dependent epimerase/dehydratase family protein, partial [Nocardioides sp.]|uniref:NAD-dependent epimerase/dehydratase family protein n=1 Tax=Nocardioides sp. TaxID=35761 RepID=UPI001A1E4A84
PHLVHMSSVGAYSPRTGPQPVPESWPTAGAPTSPYSRHKAAAERLLDDLEGRHPELVVTRLRPGIVGQGAAGSSLLRYGVPGYVPARLIGHLPVLPLDPRLEVPVVHVTDVVDAVSRVLDRTPGGAFNLAADRPVTAEMAALALTARLVPVPARVLRAVLAGAWHARLAQLDPGWLDLAYSVPLLSTDRAELELGWNARVSTVDLLAEVVEGLLYRHSAPTPVLRRRSLVDTVRHLATDGPVHRRREP